MEQRNIRPYNGQRYSKEEGSEIIDELNLRTQFNDPDYNSMQSLGEKMKVVEEKSAAAIGGFKGKIAIEDVRTEVGFYQPTESGPYPNCDGLVVDLSAGITTLSFDGTAWGIQVVPVDLPTVQETGQSTTDVMSQKAVTDELSKKVETVFELKKEIIITGDLVDDQYFKIDGTTAVFASTKRTAKINIGVYDEIWVKTQWVLSNLRIVFFDAADTFISAITHTSGVLTKLTPPIEAKFIGVSGQDGYDLVVEGRSYVGGEEIITAVDIAKNLSPKITKELIPLTFINKYYHRTTGEFLTLVNFAASERIPISSLESYLRLNGTLSTVNGCSVTFWDDAGVVIPYSEEAIYSEYYLLPPENAVEFAFSLRISTDTLTVERIGIALVQTAGISQIKIDTNSAYTSAKSSNFYQLGEDYQSIKTRTAQNNYGILFAGQSNMVGQAPYSELSTLSLPDSLAVNKWSGSAMTSPQTIASDSLWGVWWSILKRLKDYKPSTPIFNFNISNGGSTLHTDWNVENLGTWAKKFADEVYALKNYSTVVNLKCIVWIQGESDHVPPYDAAYYQRLKNFIQFVRGVVGNPKFPFLVVGHHPDCSRYNQIVRDAEVKVSEDEYFVYFINPDSLTWTHIGDDLHYDGVYNEALAPLIFDVIKDL